MRGTWTRTLARWLRATVGIFIVAVLSLLVAELIARTVFGLETLEYRRPYHPIFVSGDYHYLVPNEQLPFVAGGAVALGYRERTMGFFAESQTPSRTSTRFADYLFAHNRSRYRADEVDRISCSQKDAILVHVLGGSVAQGFTTFDSAHTWHARLEGMLRQRMRRDDIYLFNAAMGAFISLQERLAYHLAVAPRRANLVLIINGYNDAVLPANSSVLPGDPFQLGMRFSQLLTDGFWWWAARHSAIVHTLLQNAFNDDITRFRARLETDDALFGRYADAVAENYIENMHDVLDACKARGQACLVGLQPARSLTAANIGVRVDDILSQPRVVALYRRLQDRIAASRHRAHFIDLTHVFDRGERLQYYHDTVHPNLAGHQRLAQELLRPTMTALDTAKPVPASSDERCERLR